MAATVGPEEPRTWFRLPGREVAAALEVDPARGLSADEAAARLERHGPNRFAEAKEEPRWRAFARQYDDPMQIVLLVAGLGSIWPLEQYSTGVVLLLLTVLNAVLGFHFETFADRRLLIATGMSAAAIVLGTELRLLQRVLDTVSLTAAQWLGCAAVASTIVVASEAQKLLRRRRLARDEALGAPALGPTAT